MSYLIPVYKGTDKGYVGGDNPPSDPSKPTVAIDGFKGADYLKSVQFVATATPNIALTTNTQRRTATVQNIGGNDVYIGGEDVTVNNGFRLAANGTITLEIAGEIWAVCNIGTTSELRILSELDAV